MSAADEHDHEARPDVTGSNDADGRAELALYRQMVTIRCFEEHAAALYRDGHIPGFCHLSIGQEACAVGACAALPPNAVITSTHRGHGHLIAKGANVEAMFAELFGRETGLCRGRGGSMHIADPSIGVLGANGIVAAGLPIAVGAALAGCVLGENRIALAFFGDGAIAQGTFHESVNLAALWNLPVIFFCENNGFAEFSPAGDQHPVPLAGGLRTRSGARSDQSAWTPPRPITRPDPRRYRAGGCGGDHRGGHNCPVRPASEAR